MVPSHKEPQSPQLMAAVDFLTRRLGNELLAVYLFGSHASAEQRVDSDIDIAVLTTHPLDAHERFGLAEDLSRIVGRDVDLVDLRSASTVLRSQAVGRGKPLFVRNGAETEAFLDFVFADYARLNEERAEVLRDITARGRIHG